METTRSPKVVKPYAVVSVSDTPTPSDTDRRYSEHDIHKHQTAANYTYAQNTIDHSRNSSELQKKITDRKFQSKPNIFNIPKRKAPAPPITVRNSRLTDKSCLESNGVPRSCSVSGRPTAGPMEGKPYLTKYTLLSDQKIMHSRPRSISLATKTKDTPKNMTANKWKPGPENTTKVGPENVTNTKRKVGPKNTTFTERKVGPENMTISKRKIGPEKPPRTLSTFLDQESLLGSAEFITFDPCEKEPMGKVMQIITKTLTAILKSVMNDIANSESLWEVSLQEFQISSSGNTASYRGVQLSLENIGALNESTRQEMVLSKHVPCHPNLLLIRSVLSSTGTDRSSNSSDHNGYPQYIVRDAGQHFKLCVYPLRHTVSSKAYNEIILLCLIQVLSALQHLHKNGVSHGNVSMDSLYVTSTPGDQWLVKLGNFRCSLIQPKMTHSDATRFNGFSPDSRLPPEIINSSENLTLNWYTDCFSVGCLIFEMMDIRNPFKQNPHLIYSDYADKDLLSLFHHPESLVQEGLNYLSLQLLKREPHQRLSVASALLFCQALLWLPNSFFTRPVSMAQLEGYLSIERASLLCDIAKKRDTFVDHPLIMKAQFLQQCDVADLLATKNQFLCI